MPPKLIFNELNQTF